MPSIIRYSKRYFSRWIISLVSMILLNRKGRIIGMPCHVQGLKNITIGNGTTIDKGVRLECYSCKGSAGKIKIGDNCLIAFNCTFLSAGNLIIGDNVMIASNVFISTEDHGINPLLGSYMLQELKSEDIFIGDNCWIGEKVSILSGVHIGKWSIIGANSVVTKSIDDFCIAVGSPAKVVKRFNINTQRWEAV